MRLRTFIAATLVLLLGACASLNRLDNDVSTFGAWPAGRQPGSFVFERLPSQQAQPDRQQALENAARAALETAGFRAGADPATADYLVQLGARVTSNDPWIYNSPLFWRGSLRHGYGWGDNRWPGAWGGNSWGPGWGGPYSVWGPGHPGTGTYDREVALVIRERQSGQMLYETHAVSTGLSGALDALLPAMYQAAMNGFPAAGPNPRNVSVQLSSAK